MKKVKLVYGKSYIFGVFFLYEVFFKKINRFKKYFDGFF
jgi:hypothetical protein